MSEPEDVILEGLYLASDATARLWRRHSPHAESGVPRLVDVRTRLELLLLAVFGRPFEIEPADPPPTANLSRRLAGHAPRHLSRPEPVAWTDGERIALPARLPLPGGGRQEALRRYQLLALELAARVLRGTAGVAVRAETKLHRDVALLAEARAVDALLVVRLPGFAADLRLARAESASAFPLRRASLSPAERWLLDERDATLTGEMSAVADGAHATSAWDSLRWAKERMRECPAPDSYRGLPAVPIWGDVRAPSPAIAVADRHPVQEPGVRERRVRTLRRRPEVRSPRPGEEDERPGIWGIPKDDPQETVEDPMGLQRPVDRDVDTDPAELGDALADLPEARLVRTPGEPAEVLRGEAPLRLLRARPRFEGGTLLAYPEWDFRSRSYRLPGAVVRVRDGGEMDPAFARRTLRRHRRLVIQIRRRFERLRLDRVHLGRQSDGPEVDISQYARAFAQHAAGGPVEDRLYRDVRRVRREFALLVLLDVSASTDAWISGNARVIDVAKESLLLVAEALGALRERFAILAFSGAGAENVAVRRIKAFHEPCHDAVFGRIGGLQPERFTRVGAAVRHSCALLRREPARHRVLLLISDGKPNDDDVYETRYGVEDTRQAIAEARLAGIHPFCLTVDRDASRYLPRMFGHGAYAVIQRPERLPHVLIEFVRRLVRG